MSSAEPAADPAGHAAGTLLGGDHRIVGPLTGHHHETYVLRLPGEDGRWKIREPRSGVLHADRRCFHSEEDVICGLAELPVELPVPEVREVGGCRLQRFVEGATLATLTGAEGRVPERYVDQLMPVFGGLGSVRPGRLNVERSCDPADRAEDGDTTYFLGRLVHFAEHRVYRARHATYGSLFAALGVPDEALRRYAERLGMLAPRPFCLLHGDLHRENLIVDGADRLWVIDWELAMLGDPLYDLATHLYLTRYPAEQERSVVERWCAEIERVLPGGSKGYEDDLPRLRAFKCVQSVYTDVIRTAMTLSERPEDPAESARAAAKLVRVLHAARTPLELPSVPDASGAEAALREWLGSTG
ncbi:phosphotransferase [Streptomyces sp. LHD-70]|uniref:phosphotransferase n=1 Tax=Streptomyces sp. LHD-70 TaxID=3072140 RepID=UPI00280CAC84|nr:phosphotransferase [Streptomyces sp. LHD-70]MDQ8704805.1 phosphotransferase [Streptomyces sp. LHD-70]